MVDYRINLAKSVTSTSEQRWRVCKGMMIYLALCVVGLVCVVYLVSSNMIKVYGAGKQRRIMVKESSLASDFSKTFYKNPDKAYDELKLYAEGLAKLKTAFERRTHFLPPLNQLFADFPKDVAIESLEASAAKKRISFGLLGPGKSVATQQVAWKRNAELAGLVRSIKQVEGEQRIMAGQPVYFVKFECILEE